MTHDRYGRSTLHPIGKLTHTLSSNDTPQSDGALKKADRKKIIHYRRLCTDLNRSTKSNPSLNHFSRDVEDDDKDVEDDESFHHTFLRLVHSTTEDGTGAVAQFDRPCGVAMDDEGNIVIDIDVALVRCHSRSDHHAQTISLLGSLDDHGRTAVVRRS